MSLRLIREFTVITITFNYRILTQRLIFFNCWAFKGIKALSSGWEFWDLWVVHTFHHRVWPTALFWNNTLYQNLIQEVTEEMWKSKADVFHCKCGHRQTGALQIICALLWHSCYCKERLCRCTGSRLIFAATPVSTFIGHSSLYIILNQLDIITLDIQFQLVTQLLLTSWLASLRCSDLTTQAPWADNCLRAKTSQPSADWAKIVSCEQGISCISTEGTFPKGQSKGTFTGPDKLLGWAWSVFGAEWEKNVTPLEITKTSFLKFFFKMPSLVRSIHCRVHGQTNQKSASSLHVYLLSHCFSCCPVDFTVENVIQQLCGDQNSWCPQKSYPAVETRPSREPSERKVLGPSIS